jgi:hypothetical protein
LIERSLPGATAAPRQPIRRGAAIALVSLAIATQVAAGVESGRVSEFVILGLVVVVDVLLPPPDPPRDGTNRSKRTDPEPEAHAEKLVPCLLPTALSSEFQPLPT